jgi:hypothetical protein
MGKTHFPRVGGNEWVQSFYAYQGGDPYSGVVGNVFYVNSVTGVDSAGYGYSPEAPFDSIAYAITKCTADNGDIILVAPGHVETITGAAGVALNVAGVTIRGLGVGRQRGRVNYTTAAAASFDVTAARCCVDNLTFTGVGVDAVTAMINVQAADFTLKNCELIVADATNQAVLGILTTAAADRMTVQGCTILGTTDAGLAVAIRIVGGDGIRILDNFISVAGTTTLGCIENVTTTATRILIDGNVLANTTASAAVVITLHSSCTGMITNNRMSVLTGTAPIVAAAINGVGGNYYKAAVGVAAGTLL